MLSIAQIVRINQPSDAYQFYYFKGKLVKKIMGGCYRKGEILF